MRKHKTHIADRSDGLIAWTALLLLGIGLAALLTFGGVQWLGEQLNAARTFKSELVTTILGMGLVFIGPVLLLALVLMFPRWWLRAATARIKKLFMHIPSGSHGAQL